MRRRVRFLLPRAFKQSERRAILASENRPVWTINTSKYFTLPEIIKEKFWDRRIRAMRSYPFLQYSSAPENNPFYTLASADNLLNRTAIVRVFGSMVLLTVYRHLLAASRAAPGVEGEHAMKRLMFSIERAMVNFNRSLVGETPDLGYYFQQYLGVAQPTTPDKFYPTYVRLGPTDNFFKLLRPHLQRPFSPRFDEEDRAAFAYPLKHYSGAGHSSFNFSSYYNINQLSMLNMAAAVIPLVERLPTYATPDILRAKLLALSASFAKAGARGLEGIKQLMGGLEFKGATTPVTVRKL